MPIRFWSCSQPEYAGLPVSYQAADWVCIGVIVSIGPSPLAFLTVLEQGFGFQLSGGGHGFAVVCPQDLASRSARSFAGSTVGPRAFLWEKAAGLSAAGGLAAQRYWRLGTEELV